MGRVQGKAAFVTGAAQGLGRAIAVLLAREGARVAVTDINLEGAEKVAREIERETSGAAQAFELDVTDEPGWQKVLKDAVEAFGGLHILVNNAGIPSLGSVEDLDLDSWRHVHAVDLDGVFLGCKYAIAPIRASGGGSIVNMSSVAGIIASHNFAAYNSAKAAVRHLTKSVALHCARKRMNIRCNSVHPAFIDTPILDPLVAIHGEAIREKLGSQIPLGRLGTDVEVAYAVLYLASDESSFVTGSELVIDGGISAM